MKKNMIKVLNIFKNTIYYCILTLVFSLFIFEKQNLISILEYIIFYLNALLYDLISPSIEEIIYKEEFIDDINDSNVKYFFIILFGIYLFIWIYSSNSLPDPEVINSTINNINVETITSTVDNMNKLDHKSLLDYKQTLEMHYEKADEIINNIQQIIELIY